MTMIIYYCKDCDRGDQSSLPSMKCANCQKEMKDVGWSERMKDDEDAS